MTLAAPSSGAPGLPASARAAAALAAQTPLAAIVWGAVAFTLALQAASLAEVWSSGIFYDSDDAMRMVQVRDLMAGQGWFDMVVHRLDPPLGLLSHWSRIVDVPLVALIKAFGLFLSDVAAERAARIAFPTLLLGGLYWACGAAARLFAGPRYGVAGVVAAVGCGVATWQFIPGRIDHHAPQILLLVCGLAALAHSLDPAHGRRAAWCGIAIAASIGISIENLGFIVVMAATPFVAFVVQGERARRHLASFGLGLGVAMPIVFLATIPSARWLDPARDAFSIIHLTAGVAGGAACLALSRLRLERLSSRLAAGGAAGALVLALVLCLFPHALHDPLEGLDPVLRTFWLDRLQETEPFFIHLRRNPIDGAAWLIPLLFGLGGALLGAGRSQSVARGRCCCSRRRSRPGRWRRSGKYASFPQPRHWPRLARLASSPLSPKGWRGRIRSSPARWACSCWCWQHRASAFWPSCLPGRLRPRPHRRRRAAPPRPAARRRLKVAILPPPSSRLPPCRPASPSRPLTSAPIFLRTRPIRSSRRPIIATTPATSSP